MSRTDASGAYLGGIGAMLEEAELCPSCRHEFSERAHRSHSYQAPVAPPPALADRPLFEDDSDLALEEPRLPASLQIQEFEAPSIPFRHVDYRGPGFSSRVFERASRGFGPMWLPPPDLGEVI
jgi:hypothetical protein